MGSGPAQQPEPPGPPVRAALSSARKSAPATPDVAAPHWLTQLLKPRPAPIDWKRATRAAAAIGLPLALGVATNHLALGALVSIGAQCGTVTAISGPYRDRARRSGLASLAGAIGFYLGSLAGTHGWWTAGLVVLAAVVSAVISAAGNVASLAGLQLLVYVILGTHESTLVSPLVAVAGFAVGAGWALLLSVGAWPVRATAPERALVADVFDRLADLLLATGTPASRPARHALTAALNTAYDALLSARSRLQGRDRIYRKLFIVLSETTPVVEASVALLTARHRPPRSVVDAVLAVGHAVRADEPVAELTLPERGSPAVLALVDGLHNIVDVLAGHTDGRKGDGRKKPPDRRALAERIAAFNDQVLAGPTTWLHALRLALCMAIAEVITMVVPVERSYWLPLTVAIVLKPDFGSVFGRAVLRGGGTFVGALLGGTVLVLSPNGWVLVLLAAAIAFLLPIAQVRHYGMFATVMTPLVIIQLELGHVGGWNLVLTRLVDTAAGCAIVLVFGYLLWPGSRTPKIGGRLADAADAVARYADLALRADPRGRSTLRRRTYRQLSDLRTEFQRVLVEPSAAGRLAAAWYPAIIGLERVTGSVTRVAVEIDQGADPPPESEVDAIVTALRDLADAVRAERPPADPPALTAPQLAGIGGDLHLVVTGLRGPEFDQPRRFPLMPKVLRRRQ